MIYITEIIDNKNQKWIGDRVNAISWAHAEYILQNSERGYMKVVGRLTKEIDEESGNIINHELTILN